MGETALIFTKLLLLNIIHKAEDINKQSFISVSGCSAPHPATVRVCYTDINDS